MAKLVKLTKIYRSVETHFHKDSTSLNFVHRLVLLYASDSTKCPMLICDGVYKMNISCAMSYPASPYYCHILPGEYVGRLLRYYQVTKVII